MDISILGLVNRARPVVSSYSSAKKSIYHVIRDSDWQVLKSEDLHYPRLKEYYAVDFIDSKTIGIVFKM